MPKVVKEKKMSVSADSLRETILNFENYPKFLPEVVSAEVASKKGKKILVNFELELIKRFKYQLEFDISDPNYISWKLVESDFFKTNEGAWKLTSPGKNETVASYEVDVSFGFMVPSWISKKLTEVNLPRLLESFETQTLSKN